MVKVKPLAHTGCYEHLFITANMRTRYPSNTFCMAVLCLHHWAALEIGLSQRILLQNSNAPGSKTLTYLINS